MKELAMPHRISRRRGLVLLALPAMAASPAFAAFAAVATPPLDRDDPEASPRWQQVRRSLFGTRIIRSGADSVVTLEAPERAEDAAVVPVALRPRIAQTAERHVRRLVLVIDSNPSPVAAIFDTTPDSGRADIETRVRVDEYTFVRAIAETSDGELSMSTRFVKASGGCSAPPGKDPAAARATLGRMRLRVQGEPRAGVPLLAQLMISHPNDSGLVMDPLTRQYTPPHFVRSVELSYAGRTLLSADLDFAISENPHLRFWLVPRAAGGELRAKVVDSHDLHFEQAIMVGSAQ
jgi:sulfur-oxidizing protein SoxY